MHGWEEFHMLKISLSIPPPVIEGGKVKVPIITTPFQEAERNVPLPSASLLLYAHVLTIIALVF